MAESTYYSPTFIRRPLSKEKQWLIGFVSVVVFVLVWFLLTMPVLKNPEFGQVKDAPELISIVHKSLLPSPISILAATQKLYLESGLLESAFSSFYRVTISFLLAVLVALPLGFAMAAWQPLKAWVQPIMDPLRFLPLSAVTALFILWFGIGESEKIAFLFAGTVVYLLPLIVEEIILVESEYVDTALTLGAKPWQLITHILLPSSLPGIWESMRVIYGVGWTYVILAEVIKTSDAPGLGAMIFSSQRVGRTDQVFALLIIVLLIAVISNEFFVQIAKAFFSWKQT